MAADYGSFQTQQPYLRPGEVGSGGMYDGTSSESSAPSPLYSNVSYIDGNESRILQNWTSRTHTWHRIELTFPAGRGKRLRRERRRVLAACVPRARPRDSFGDGPHPRRAGHRRTVRDARSAEEEELCRKDRAATRPLRKSIF